jgi:hypothetical protein
LNHANNIWLYGLYGLYVALESSRLCGTALKSNPPKTSWHVVCPDGQVLLGAGTGADGYTEKGAEFGQTVTSFMLRNPSFIGDM